MGIRHVAKGAFAALVLTAVFIFTAAAVMYFSDIDEKLVNIGIYASTAASMISGSVVTARSARSKVLLNCLITGFVYLAVMAVMTLIVKGGIFFNYHFFAVTGGVIACSIFGAVIGRT